MEREKKNSVRRSKSGKKKKVEDQGEEEDEMMKGTMTTIRCACAGHEVITVVRGSRTVHIASLACAGDAAYTEHSSILGLSHSSTCGILFLFLVFVGCR